MKVLIFLCCACVILVFTIINVSVGPIVSRRVGSSWGYLNCKYYKDLYDEDPSTGDEKKYVSQWRLNYCKNRKGIHDME